jgi:hypothetical protein
LIDDGADDRRGLAITRPRDSVLDGRDSGAVLQGEAQNYGSIAGRGLNVLSAFPGVNEDFARCPIFIVADGDANGLIPEAQLKRFGGSPLRKDSPGAHRCTSGSGPGSGGDCTQTVAVIPLWFLARCVVGRISPSRRSSETLGRTDNTDLPNRSATASADNPVGASEMVFNTCSRSVLTVLRIAVAACSDGPETLKPGVVGYLSGRRLMMRGSPRK